MSFTEFLVVVLGPAPGWVALGVLLEYRFRFLTHLSERSERRDRGPKGWAA